MKKTINSFSCLLRPLQFKLLRLSMNGCIPAMVLPAKQLLAAALLLLCTLGSRAQDNNPFSQRGKDYLSSISLVIQDYKDGKIAEFNDATLEHYSKMVPLQNHVSADLVASIIKISKAPGFNFHDYIGQTAVTDCVKSGLAELYANAFALDGGHYMKYLVKKTDEVKNASCTDEDRELLLTIIAMNYSVMEQQQTGSANPGGRQRAACTITGPNGTEEAPCAVVGAIVGGGIGMGICGILCGIGGAIVGGVVGSLS